MKAMRKLIPMLLIIVMLMSCFTHALADFQMLQATGTCYLRSEPDKDSKNLATISKGSHFKPTQYSIDDRGVYWYKITYNGKKGWVSGKNLKPYKEADPTKKPSEKPHTIDKTKFLTTGSCYLRSEADKDSKKLGTLSKDTVITTTKYQKDDRGVKWYQTKYDGATGWVSEKNLKKYVDPKPTAKPTAKPTVKPTEKPHTIDKTKMITTATCYLRKEADADSKKLDTLSRDTVITTTKYQKDERGVKWYQTKYDGATGWVSERNLKKYTDPKPTAKPTPKPTAKPTAAPTMRSIDYSKFTETGYYARVTSNGLNLRMAPSSEYDTIEVLQRGDVVYCVRSNGDWSEVEDSVHGRHGYMYNEYLEKVAAPKTVTPIDASINVDALEDGEYPVSFSASDVQVGTDGVTVINNITIYAEDIYDASEIEALQAGDTIVIDGEEIVVEKMRDHEYIDINDGFDAGGFSLVDCGNGYRIIEADDFTNYSAQGTTSLKLSADASYSDDADLDAMSSGMGSATTKWLTGAKGGYGFSCYNTTVQIENGEIVNISRFYTP